MSHTLHRVGTEENLKHDFVFLCMPSKDINHEGSAPKLHRFFQLCEKNHCVTIGDCRGGNEWYQKEKYHLQDNLEGRQHMIDNVEDRAVITATFKDEADVVNMLRDLKQEDLGMSIVVSGLVDHTKECCHHADLEPHTVEHSLGRIGRTDLLPPNEILEIATMCGHSMVSVNFINEMIEKCRKGKCTPEEAAAELFKPCMCGIFNTDRAAMLIRAIIEA